MTHFTFSIFTFFTFFSIIPLMEELMMEDRCREPGIGLFDVTHV